MAEAAEPTEHVAERDYPLTTLSVVAPIAGWLVPGGGHFLQKKWTRGALLLASVGAMFSIGILAGGKVYQGNFGDLLDILGFVGDAGAGALYFSARMFGWGADSVSSASANYGTIFIIVAGLLNIISAVDAHQIALGKKP